jgi:ABC-type multidrug transport system permease subunit
MISINIAEGNVKIGSEGAISKETFEQVTLVKIKKETIHTDYIMGKYDYILKGDEAEDMKNIQMLIDKKANKSGLTGEKQLIAMLITAYLVIATMYASKQIADQSNKTLERYCYAGNKKGSYMFGTFYSTAIIVFLEVMVALLLFYFLTPDFTYSFAQVIGLGMKITLITSSFAAILSQFARSEMSANMIAAFFAVFSSIIGGTFVAVNAMPKFLQVLSIISPVRWLLSI